MKLLSYEDVKMVVEDMLARQYHADCFSLNAGSTQFLKELVDLYGTEFPNIGVD